MSDALLAGVVPELADKVRVLLKWALDHNRDARVVEGLRSPTYQMSRYVQGRAFDSVHGWYVVSEADVVTNAIPTVAPHCRGGAVDIALFEGGRKLTCDAVHLVPAELARQIIEYTTMGAFAESLGLVWGGRWHSIKDWDHVELSGWRDLPMLATTQPSAEVTA